jgi:hypothetical protein
MVIDPNFFGLGDFHCLPPFGFGFDIHKPPEVSIMYPFRICNNFGQFDSWRIRKGIHDSLSF